MSLSEVLDSWFATYGNTHSTVELVARVSDDTWAVVLDDDTQLTATIDEPTGRMGLISGLGKPAEIGRERVLEGLLMYSLMWRETGGVRAAIDGDGEAQLIAELMLHDLTESGLHWAIENFTAKTQVLTEFVATGRAADDDPQTMIRL